MEVHAGHHELIIRGRYETLSIANDILIGLIFLAGSFLFFHEDTVYAGTWLFVVGSALMLVRPSIRITRRVHLQRLSPNRAPEASHDF
ncbi:MAG: YrhK family protein [Kocuria sp.]|nr:YrhK family protein [Kocuria sp.]MDO4919181.1 YrhK family protein [Kocuria sp.]